MITGSETTQPAGTEKYPHHRECVACGYDLYGQPVSGLCPECGGPVAKTAERPFWSVSCPHRLARSRIGLRVITWSCLVYILVLLIAAIGSASTSDGGILDLVAALTAGATGLAFITGLVFLGIGAGTSAWRRWAPLALVLLMVAVSVTLGLLIPDANVSIWFQPAIALTLLWQVGLSLQSLIINISTGVATRAALVRSTRFMKVTRLLLFAPPALAWTLCIVMHYAMDLGWGLIGLLLLTLEVIAGLLGLWLILTTVHWFRLLKLWKVDPPAAAASPRTLAS